MYALFAGEKQDDNDAQTADGGWLDLKAINTDLEKLLKQISKTETSWFWNKTTQIGWWHIINLENRMVMRSNLFADDWNWLEETKFGKVDPYFRKASEEEQEQMLRERTKV